MDIERSCTLDLLLPALAGSTRIMGASSVAVNALEIDSRSVRPGSLFVALRGEHTDGHRFVGQAVERGAVAVLLEEPCDLPAHVTCVIVPDTARALSQLAHAFNGRPSEDLAVAGITGTNGKTTTAQMAAAILNAAAIASGYIGTLGACLRERTWALQHTTPLASELAQLLAHMRDGGAKAVAMEVSSHALALQRVADVRFEVGALTNVTRDHLDFHKTFDAYAAAKRSLFEAAHRCVLNADDGLGARWSSELRGRKPVVTYAMRAPADVRPENVELRSDGSIFYLNGRRFEVRLPGRFNVANALCAIGIARMLGAADAHAAEGLASLQHVAGRMEHVHANGVDVVVDYAHTPDALENVLRALRETAARRLLIVFGCGGDRDRGKRPQMGAAAARYADYAYVTSDNPRTEDPHEIVDAILPGIGTAPHAVRLDRREAIEAAIADARQGDVVLIAGKGHESFQIVGTQAVPFDDLAVAREALAHREALHR